MSDTDIVDYVSPNAPDLPSKEQVRLLCTKQGRRENHFIHVHNGKKLFIKYEVPRCEWENHRFLFDRMKTNTTIRIPEIYAVFRISYRLYMIMEFIETDHVASDLQRARAISEIVSVEVPLDISPGPVGGGRIHMGIFWDDGISDIAYPSIQDLENHLNRVLKVFKFPDRELEHIDFSRERVICCYTDLEKSHFLVDKDGQLWVFAFRQVNFLPETFMYFALGRQLGGGGALPREYYDLIPVMPTQNLDGLRTARRWFLHGSSRFYIRDSDTLNAG